MPTQARGAGPAESGVEWRRHTLGFLHPDIEEDEDSASLDALHYSGLLDPLQYGAETVAGLHDSLLDR